MMTGKFLQRQKELLFRFRTGIAKKTERLHLRIEKFGFVSEVKRSPVNGKYENPTKDVEIQENRSFTYPVFAPAGKNGFRSCILLLHGLNERSWDKYLYWAEYLAVNTRKPVILFPIAFHINRAPSDWGNPRSMALLMDKRRKDFGDPGSLSFVNAALSERLTEAPVRFYNSGRQTVRDISWLAKQIRNGDHPLFPGGATMDLFGYSIGSFLAEILLMANPGNLFSSSRLFIFCGGTIFSHMHGESRYIMDKTAYDRLFKYYCDEWFSYPADEGYRETVEYMNLRNAFNSMIRPEINRDTRENFFKRYKTRIAGISLLKDKIMPFEGVEACMGNKPARECFEVVDFPYEYSHESPFPANGRIDEEVLDTSFRYVFRKCAAFLL